MKRRNKQNRKDYVMDFASSIYGMINRNYLKEMRLFIKTDSGRQSKKIIIIEALKEVIPMLESEIK